MSIFSPLAQSYGSSPDKSMGIRVGDGERFDTACDPLSIPLRAATLLNTPLMYQTFPYACLAHIPKSAQPFVGLDLLLGVTTSITPAADMKAMTRPLPRPRNVWFIDTDVDPSANALHQRLSSKKCPERCQTPVKMRKIQEARRDKFRESIRRMVWWIGVLCP